MADIDDICEEFEAAWSTGAEPPLEHFLARVDTSQRDALFDALLAIELDYRLRKSGNLSPAFFEDRFPEFRSRVSRAIKESLRRLMEIEFASGATDLEALVARIPLLAHNQDYLDQLAHDEAALRRKYGLAPADRSKRSPSGLGPVKETVSSHNKETKQDRTGGKRKQSTISLVEITMIGGVSPTEPITIDTHQSLLCGTSRHCRLRPSCSNAAPALFRVEVKPPFATIRDLCGNTRVNGQTVSSAELVDGDHIRCGDVHLRYGCVDRNVQSADADAGTPPFPRVIGNYLLDDDWISDRLGHRVAARHQTTRARVMVRLIPAAGLSAASFWQFTQRTRQLERLVHKRFVRWHESNRDEPFLFVVSDCYDDLDFLAVLRKQSKPRRVRLTCGVAGYILQALHDAHEQGITHGMVCPASIAISYRHGKIGARLADTRIETTSREIGVAPFPSYCGLADGDEFASPERFADVSLDTVGNDLYGVAASLYFFLAERPPREIPKEPAQIIAHAQTEAPTPLIDVIDGIPPTLSDVVQKGLAPDPADRFATAAEFYEQLVPFTKSKTWRSKFTK